MFSANFTNTTKLKFEEAVISWAIYVIGAQLSALTRLKYYLKARADISTRQKKKRESRRLIFKAGMIS